MLKLGLVILYGILCVAAAVIKISKHNGKDKSVNLALETVFEFDNEDKKTDVNILNKVQRFIGKVKNVIENNFTGRRQLDYGSKYIFTSFMFDVIQILNQYNDRDLENFASVFSQEMKNHHYAGCKFHELASNVEEEKLFAKKLAEFSIKPAKEIRDRLRAIFDLINDKKYVKTEKELLDTINSLYKEESMGKIYNFLIDIDNYRQRTKEDINITKVIREGLRTIIFDHYTNLTTNLRTSLLLKVQEYIKYYNDNVAPKIIPVTKKKQALRTMRQLYLEDLEIQERSKIKDKKETSVSQRSYDMLTTRKSKSKHKKDIVRTITEKHNKVYRFQKVDRMNDENKISTYKKRRIETTKDVVTMRQMYVEKNMDLKYNPDAYEHLTTARKRKTKKLSIRPLNSPTTLKHTHKRDKLNSYTPHKRVMKKKRVKQNERKTSDFDESNTSFNKGNKEDETPLTDFLMDIPYGDKSITTYKLTKMARHFGETFIDKDLDYNYEVTPEYRSKPKKLTFKTLYPTFVIEWSDQPPGSIRQFGVTPEFKVRISKHGSHERDQLYTYEPGNQGGIKLEKDLDYSIDVKKPKNWDLDIRKKTNLNRYHSEDHHKDNKRISGAHVHQTTTDNPSHVPVLRRQADNQYRESADRKLEMSRDPMILARHYEFPLQFSRNNFRRQFTQRMISEEGLSIEGLKYNPHNIQYRRKNNVNTIDSSNGNIQVLQRIQNLEKELEFVKNHLKNDTYVNNNLDSNVFSVSNNDMRDIPADKTTKSLDTKADFNRANVYEPNRINGDEFNKNIPQVKRPDNYVINIQSSGLNTENRNIETTYDAYQYTTQSKLTEMSKEAHNPDVDVKGQGRKYFINVKKMAQTSSDNNKISKNSNNFSGSKPKDFINKQREINFNKVATDKYVYLSKNEEMDKNKFNTTADQALKNKHSSIVTQANNDTYSNQTDTKLDASRVGTVPKERQSKDNQDHKEENENVIENNTKALTVSIEIPSNNSKSQKQDGKVDYDGIVFRGMDITTSLPVTIFRAQTIGYYNELSKVNKETTKDSNFAFDNIVSIIKMPASNITTTIDSKSSDVHVKRDNKGPFIDIPTDVNFVKDREENNKISPTLTVPLNKINETLSENSKTENFQMISNMTVNIK